MSKYKTTVQAISTRNLSKVQVTSVFHLKVTHHCKTSSSKVAMVRTMWTSSIGFSLRR